MSPKSSVFYLNPHGVKKKVQKSMSSVVMRLRQKPIKQNEFSFPIPFTVRLPPSQKKYVANAAF